MNIIKSTLVLLFLLWTVLHTIKYTIRTATDYKRSSRRLVGWFKISICSFFALLILTSLYDYIWPFDRSLTPVLVAEMDIPEEHTLDYPGQKSGTVPIRNMAYILNHYISTQKIITPGMVPHGPKWILKPIII